MPGGNWRQAMKTILVATDFSDVTERVLAQTATMAKAFGATVYLVYVEAPDPDFVGYEGGPVHVREDTVQAVAHHHEAIHKLRDGLRAQGIDAHGLVIQGTTVDKIVDEAQRLPADLIIVGSHGHGALLHLLLGSVSEGVIKHASCPVLVVPSREA
jgi:nucleotide-binding universal stress UspA family protein